MAVYNNQFSIVPVGTHQRTSTNGIVTMQIPNSAGSIVMQAEGQVLRYTLDGSNPTAGYGFRLAPSEGVIRLDMLPGRVVKAVGEVTGGFINYQYAQSII